MRACAWCVAALLAACASGPPPLDWQLNARGALAQYERYYFAGETKLAEREFENAKAEIARTGRLDLLARAELLRCAARTASLEFDGCPGFEASRAEAGAEELAYADYLAGRTARAPTEQPMSQLVAAGLRLRAGTITPQDVAAAIDVASAQGWRRPLLAWLAVQARRAEESGDQASLARIRRRIEFVTTGK
ncbi:MAG TPA: hypothetical protein VL280_13015 [Burkholderiales bacterium]|jgi:hypothetical protein|nr:hypothetical protein [Burkholderiales bacterium]